MSNGKTRMMVSAAIAAFGCVASVATLAADQTVVGAGNTLADKIGAAAPLVQTAEALMRENAQRIEDRQLRQKTLDALFNANTCIVHRAGLTETDKNAIVQQIEQAGLVNPADAATITGGIKAGFFPPVLNDNSACPQLPLHLSGTPGSNFGGHHSYPGGLAVHESFNDQSSIDLANTYRGEYAHVGEDELPVSEGSRGTPEDGFINQDVILAAPLWHDWAKMLVFQWNADGTEFAEMSSGGTGINDNFGAAGDSRTGTHHILSIAEAMARGLSPELVITQAAAHSNPTLGNEFKVVNWLRTAALIARIDPVARGYLTHDALGNLRLPALLALDEGEDLLAAGQGNVLVEYQIHNLSDANFTESIAAVTISQALLQTIAPRFGFNPANTADYNNKFRNVVLAYLSAERLHILYSNGGLAAVVKEVSKLRARHVL